MLHNKNVNGTNQEVKKMIKQFLGFILFLLLMLSVGFIEKPSDYHLPLEVTQNYNY